MQEAPLRVLVVDDTVTYRKIVGAVLERIPGVEVVGAAANGRIALDKIDELRPDLLTLDVEMPEMDGLEVLRELRRTHDDLGVIMLSSFTNKGAKSTMDALASGAFDFVLKPSGGTPQKNAEVLRSELQLRIEAFARTRQIRRILSGHLTEATCRQSAATPPPKHRAPPRRQPAGTVRQATPEVVAVGVSTGGPRALGELLPRLPADLAAPVLIVQHMPAIFTKSLAEDLDRRSALRVHEAVDGEPVRPGQVVVAPGGRHMKVERTDKEIVVRVTDDPPENSCRPSVDYLFRSVMEVYGPNALGVIMTGMGNDGARGCELMKQQGATIIAQDAATCVVFGMPKQPIESGAADVVSPLNRIAAEIIQRVGRGRFHAGNRR
jgi:two-component system chemotaxis response regulator CheB